jgi:hypothetical protein
MSQSRDFATKEIWLIVARGGWWSPAEVKKLLPPELQHKDVAVKMWDMANRKETLTTDGKRFRPRYSLTPDCYVPNYLTVGEIQQAKLAGTT